MDLHEFKSKHIKDRLGLNGNNYGKIFVFIDFANVNNWFSDDTKDGNGNVLDKDKKLEIDLEELADFIKCFSDHARFYYGHDPKNQKSMRFLGKTKYVFGKHKVITKPIQQIKHYLGAEEKGATTRLVRNDKEGEFIYIPKCNFDVEICVDSIRLMNKYDSFCIFSSDADFVSLITYLRNNRKKIILIKGGFVQYPLKANSDLVINAQDIKKYITRIKQKSSG